ncbi:GDSL esterase/lipase 7-like [Mercurialis annua]|uniref:GDSL esterase/lipase 7-like n=1 Tax=Mercurialis annua TaxID=3986 RepID=UPI00215EE820|nr:GDSL esterase/lipase 7-like [Mercurialis annua]
MKVVSVVLLFVLCNENLVSGLPLAPALYVFGDSLFDNGNNNFLPTFAKANFLPYGVDFAHGVTGRFTNGRTVADFIAEFLRLPYPPPLLSIRTSPVTGLNLASGSCGILPQTGSHLGKCLSLNDQIDLFEATVESEISTHFKTKNEFSNYLSKSICIFSIGSNDYINYFDTSANFVLNKHTPQVFAQLLLDKLSHNFERLYILGVRKILMFEIGPIGCIPSISRSRHGAIRNEKCEEGANQMVSYFNDKLAAMLQNLTSTLPDSTFVYGHANWLGYDAVINPSRYGLMDTSNPCCRTWGNGTSACIPWISACSFPNKHYFFDAFHLTETVCSSIASHCINDKSVCSPTLDQLIKM